MLNIEQYEYMFGFYDVVGIKMLFYDRDEIFCVYVFG